MINRINLIGLCSFAFVIMNSCKSQSNIGLDGLVFSSEKELPSESLDRVKERRKSYYRVFKNDTLTIKNYSEKFIFSKLDTSQDYNYILEAKYWIVFNYREGIPKLIKRITDDKEIGLNNYNDLIITERIENGDMKIDGHGTMVRDDLFKVCGRANYLLKEITGINFGDVKMDSNQEELKILQAKWVKWLKDLHPR